MKVATCLLSTVFTASAVFAETHAVLPGGAIQEKVDLAQPGDIVAVSAGTYPGDVTVNKAIRLVEMDGHEVTITGNVTFTGVTNAPPFEGFTVGSPGKGISVTNTTGIVLKNIDARAGLGVTVNGNSKAGITGGFYSKIVQDGGELTASLTLVTGDFETTVNSTKTVSYRVITDGNYVWNSRMAWCGYSKGWHFKSSGVDGKVVVIGSEFDGRNYSPNPYPGSGQYTENFGIAIYGSGNSININNNTIRKMAYGAQYPSNFGGAYSFYTAARGVYVSGAQQSVIVNNYVQLQLYFWDGGSHNDAAGVRVETATAKILNNIIEGAIEGVRAPFGADVRNNYFYALQGAPGAGGHVAIGSLSGDPSYVSGQAPLLQPSSPCINAGVNDPIFNDLDGTRSDIGPGGGCLFDPQGWTTTKPVVISFDLAPQQLLRGVDTQVNLTKGLAVGQP